MITKLNFRLFHIAVIILLILHTEKLLSQTFSAPLFELQRDDLIKRVYVENEQLICEVNKSIVSRFSLESKPFTFLNGVDNKSFALIKYYFGQKFEKSSFELYLLNENFSVTFYNKYEFYYEEPLPKILVLNSEQFLFFYPSTGKVKIITKSRETEIDLLKNENLNFFQERIGHLIPYLDKVVITLSQLKENDRLISKAFLLNIETLEFETFRIDLSVIYKIFQENSGIYLTGIKTETGLITEFYALEVNEEDFGQSKLVKIADEFIEGKVKNSPNLFFGKNCFYNLKDISLVKTDFCLNDEIILDAISTEKSFVVITRKELYSNLYRLDKGFRILEKETIERYMANPELKFGLDKNLYLIDRNKTILVKNFSEE